MAAELIRESRRIAMAALLWTLATTAYSAQPFGADYRQNFGDYGSFNLWVSDGPTYACSIDFIALQKRLYPYSIDHAEPRLKWWINGQPAGPTIHVRVTSYLIAPGFCGHIVGANIEYYAHSGLNTPNLLASYMVLGPQLVTTRVGADDVEPVSDLIQGQVRAFTDAYRNVRESSRVPQ